MLSKIRKKKKQEALDTQLDKYIAEEQKDVMKAKLEKISRIISDTEEHIEKSVKAKVKVAADQIRIKDKDLVQIKKAGIDFETFSLGLKSAMPSTEKERLSDMEELKTTISILESLDADAYETIPKVVDAGLGMFYEKMSRRFKSIISDHNLSDYNIVPVPRIMYHAFLTIKNIKEKDILPILNIMRDTNLLSDIIEINPTFHIIVFIDEKLKLSLQDKVIISFVYDNENLTIQKLMKLTEWKKDYTNNIIKKLSEKNIINLTDETIRLEGFGTWEERSKWNELIKEKTQTEKEKEDKKFMKQSERKKELEQRLARIETIELQELDEIQPESESKTPKIKFRKKPKTKPLPKSKKKVDSEKKKKIQEKQEIKDKDNLISAMEELDEIMPTQNSKSGIERQQVREEEADLEDLIPERILAYHEKYSIVNGGFVQFEKLKNFIDQDLIDAPEDLIRIMLEQLKELKMIQDSIQIGNSDFYLFNKISLSEEAKALIEYAINKIPMKKEEFKTGLKWSEEQILATMKDLQEKGILRIEKDKIIIPGIIQISKNKSA